MIDNLDVLLVTSELCDVYARITERAAYLDDQISLCDKEIQDIEHAAEFFNLNASKGYKLYKMLHDVRIRRREYKQERDKIKVFLEYSVNRGNVADLKNKVAKIDAEKKYKPRVLKELFEC